MIKKVYFEILPSTNTYLKENYHKYDDKTAIICHQQTNGHGRLGRNWDSERKNSITMSILLKPKTSKNIALLSLLTSAALFDVIKNYHNDTKIKWPNDILVNNKKISGILLESIYKNKFEAVIIGIGINVNNVYFPKSINHKATSLKKELNIQFDIEEIINQILFNFEKYYKDFLKDNNSYIDICRKHSAVIGKDILINGQKVKVIDILDNGNLLVYDGNKTIDFSYGEITLENSY